MTQVLVDPQNCMEAIEAIGEDKFWPIVHPFFGNLSRELSTTMPPLTPGQARQKATGLERSLSTLALLGLWPLYEDMALLIKGLRLLHDVEEGVVLDVQDRLARTRLALAQFVLDTQGDMCPA
ncbi:MAG: hypothetical protein MK098_14700 [Marinovum sp.]|nr:hypothetical protein [Marinovum sp.]